MRSEGILERFFYKVNFMKFKLHEKLKYMFLGGVLTLAGFMFGNMNSDTEAQLGYETIDKLVVGKLIVRKDITVVSDDMEPRVLISWDREGGAVRAYGPGGEGTASLAVSKLGGSVRVYDVRNQNTAAINAYEEGGMLSVSSAINQVGATVSSDESGGKVMINSINGDVRAALMIIQGEGVVFTKDRYGRTNALD